MQTPRDSSTAPPKRSGMTLDVAVKRKLNLWDWSVCQVPIPVGDAQQPLRWLGNVACSIMSFKDEKVPTKGVPQAVKINDVVMDIDKKIKDVCKDGDFVVVEYTSGPEAFTQDWEGRKTRKLQSKLDSESNDQIYGLIHELDALITKVIELITDVVEEVDQLLYGHYDKISGASGSEGSPEGESPLASKGEESEAVLLDEDGNPIAPVVPPPIPPQPKDTFMEIPLPYFDKVKYGVIEVIQECLPDLDEFQVYDEFVLCRDMIKGYDGALQAMLVWYSAKGIELEDKDFGVLRYEQWRELWKDAQIPSDVLDPKLIESMWHKMVAEYQKVGSYQLDAYGFYAAIIHLASTLYDGCGSTPDLSSLGEMVAHLITELLIPNFGVLLKPKLEDLHNVEDLDFKSAWSEIWDTTRRALAIHQMEEETPKVQDNQEEEGADEKRGSILEGLEAPPPPPPPPPPEPEKKKDPAGKEIVVVEYAESSAQVCVPETVQSLYSYFKKWEILGPNWNCEAAAVAIIYSLQTSTDIQEFQRLPTDPLTFGLIELRRMLLVSSHHAYLQLITKRVSEPSFFRTHIRSCFIRAGIAKPLYSNYEEKKQYLRTICFRYGGKPPPQPPVFEKK